jgi:hypothetical protein
MFSIFVDMIKLRLLFTLLLFVGIQLMNAQIIKINRSDSLKKKRNFYDDFYWGTNFNLGLGFGAGAVSSVDISPFLGYKITKDVSVGMCAVYNYFGYYDGQRNQSINIYGGRVFSRIKIISQIFAQGEAETVFLSAKTLNGKLQANGYYAGLGYNQAFDGKFGSYIVLLYNFQPTEINPSFLVYRVGFHIGF